MYKILMIIIFVVAFVWVLYDPGFENIIACLTSLAIYFKDKVFIFIGLKKIPLYPKEKIIKDLSQVGYSFCIEKYIHPLIIDDLIGYMSDHYGVINQINLSLGNNSNRYHGDIYVEKDDLGNKRVVSKEKTSRQITCYQYIGCSFSGVHILFTGQSGGGSGFFSNIIFCTIVENSIYEDGEVKKYIYIKYLGHISLGDRYNGSIRYKLGFLYIPECNNRWCSRKRELKLVF